MATAEQTASHRLHVDFGDCPKHFLEGSGSLVDLSGFVEQYYYIFGNNNMQFGQSSGQPEFVNVVPFGSKEFSIIFYQPQEENVQREYLVFNDKLILYDEDGKEVEVEGEENFARHAFYITAHLRSAGIIELSKKGQLPPR